MPRTSFVVSLCAALLLLVGGADRGAAASSGEAVAVQRKVPFAPESGVRLAVKKECELQTKVPRFVKQYAPDYGLEVRLVDDLEAADASRKLEIVITSLEAPESWNDEDAWMLVTGTLYESGRKVGSVQSLRATEGGAFAQFKSSCAIIGRCSKAIGDDLAGWLKKPEDGMRIGNWRGVDLPSGIPSHPSFPGSPPGPHPPTPNPPSPPGPDLPGPW